MVKNQINKLPGSMVEIICEASAQEFDDAYRETLLEYKKNSEVPGFRKGFAPENILIEKIGEKNLLEKAAEKTINKIYPEIIEERGIEPIGRPEIYILKIAKGNPLGFKIISAVIPEVLLPDYKKLAGEILNKKEEIKVEEAEIESNLLRLKTFLSEKIKKEGGEEPIEINDDFAKKLGRFNSLSELKNAVAENIKFEKTIKNRDKKRLEALEKISKETKIDVPAVLIEAEKEKMIQELRHDVSEMGLGWEKYLEEIKKTEEELRKNFEEEAKKRATYGLILREIADKEKLEADEKEIGGYLERFFKLYPQEEREKIDKERYRVYASGLIRNEKVFQLLEKE